MESIPRRRLKPWKPSADNSAKASEEYIHDSGVNEGIESVIIFLRDVH